MRTNQITPKKNYSEDNGKPNNEEQTNNNDQNVTRESNKKDDDENKNEAPMEEFVIDKIVDHKMNRNRRQRYVNAGEPVYCVRWYD